MTLHLGVADVPYANAKEAVTTGDVATWLERKYHLFEIFYELHKDRIAELLADVLRGEIQRAMMGGPRPNLSLAAANTEIEDMFRKFLSTQEVEKLGYPGIPTEAALKGVSHRLKHPYAKGNPRRPSFIDTGLLESAFRSWVTGGT